MKLFERKQAIYKTLDERYLINGQRYKGQQYSQIYFARLHHLRNLLHSPVTNWKPHLQVLELEENKECVIVGTIYKHMKLKPSILDEYSKERTAVPLVKPHNFLHPDDHLILEDEIGRVKLKGSLLIPTDFVTGIGLALHGKKTSEGDFLVLDVLEAGLPRQIKPRAQLGEDKYVVFISGVNVGSNIFNPLQFQLFVDHVTGHLGGENEQKIASEIVRVVIAGNSIGIPQGVLNGQALTAEDQSKLIEPIKEIDILLTQLVAAVPLDMMPGPIDPANFFLPQQPLHQCLFPGASAYNTFFSCTNPHQFELDGFQFLGTSGQNIDDLEKYSSAKTKLEFVERTLRCRHLAPTAPNTLGCYPFTEKDPFFIESCPNVYFVGNQEKYETRLLQGPEKQLVRLICIPRFSESGVAVMLNLKNFDCHTLNFSADLDP
ncbi:DNA polymerase delta small subunit isoform X2 [Phalaenopsis equestris]|uniref:DNA polymerase delta small subunit isoform X2 n=1 Tax=Phalaenopsis equestris TaxID=78828 RepID=UPI0009E596FC|nr:DNA polymerase delta small subunit isoform X2 [Phalaenopsis equestris]